MLTDNRPGNRNNQQILFMSGEHFRFNPVDLSSSADLSITWNRADPAGHPEDQVEHKEQSHFHAVDTFMMENIDNI